MLKASVEKMASGKQTEQDVVAEASKKLDAIKGKAEKKRRAEEQKQASKAKQVEDAKKRQAAVQNPTELLLELRSKHVKVRQQAAQNIVIAIIKLNGTYSGNEYAIQTPQLLP
jgi:hypothetical protein